MKIKILKIKSVFVFSIIFLICTSMTTYNNIQIEDNIITVKVKGITCGIDLKMIQTNVENIIGVKKCKVIKQGSTTVFEIKYDPQQVTEEDLYIAIEGTGSCKNPNEKPYKVK